VGGVVNQYNHYGNSMEVILKVKNWIAIWPNKPITGFIGQWKWHQYVEEVSAIPYYWSTFHNSHNVESTWVSTKGWMDKEAVLCLHSEYCTALKKKKILSFAWTQMNQEDVMLSEINQNQKDKYCVISLLSKAFSP
jgi:hypothetical protein